MYMLMLFEDEKLKSVQCFTNEEKEKAESIFKDLVWFCDYFNKKLNERCYPLNCGLVQTDELEN